MLIPSLIVQSYTINSAKVIFLKPRPQSRPFKGSGNVCLTCDRILQEPFHFCSLSCKVSETIKATKGLVTTVASSPIMHQFSGRDMLNSVMTIAWQHMVCMQVDHVTMQGGDLFNTLQYSGGVGGGDTTYPDHLAFPQFENLRVDGSDLDDDTDGGQITPNSTLEDPTQHYGNGGGASSDNGDTRAVVVARRGEAGKRKKGGGFFPQIVLSLGNRRKGAPHRSPLA